MTVKCESCPTLVYCLARLSDPTITGCGMPLYEAGLIRREEILVMHTVREERENDRDKRH